MQAVGHLSSQMLVHIVLMNAVAPFAALALSRIRPAGRWDWRRFLFPAMVVQLALLWAWHAPPVLGAVSQSAALHAVMQVSLFSGALWFWSAVFFIRDDGRWRAILALLLTSKLFCLLGVLLIFAPRLLYPSLTSAGIHGMHASGLGDQQLAGLLMIVACPATYVLAGIVIAARWFGDMDAAAATERIASGERRSAA